MPHQPTVQRKRPIDINDYDCYYQQSTRKDNRNSYQLINRIGCNNSQINRSCHLLAALPIVFLPSSVVILADPLLRHPALKQYGIV